MPIKKNITENSTLKIESLLNEYDRYAFQAKKFVVQQPSSQCSPGSPINMFDCDGLYRLATACLNISIVNLKRGNLKGAQSYSEASLEHANKAMEEYSRLPESEKEQGDCKKIILEAIKNNKKISKQMEKNAFVSIEDSHQSPNRSDKSVEILKPQKKQRFFNNNDELGLNKKPCGHNYSLRSLSKQNKNNH